jgi:hypothetical protein
MPKLKLTYFDIHGGPTKKRITTSLSVPPHYGSLGTWVRSSLGVIRRCSVNRDAQILRLPASRGNAFTTRHT